MNLDDHARRAASELRHRVEPAIDVDGAEAAIRTGSRHRSTRRHLLTSGVVVVAVLGLLGGLVAMAGRNVDGGRQEAFLPGDEELSAAGAAILNGMPESAIDGRESWRLPVLADPQSGLEEGDLVTLYGRGFEPGELVGAVHCSSEADTSSAGVGACDLGDEEYAFAHTISGTARADGSVVIELQVQRFITTPEGGKVDCQSAAERCLLAIGAANDYDRSGGTYVNFAEAPPFPEPRVTLDPAGPFTPGQQVQVRAEGLMPGRPAQAQQCVDDRCAVLAQGRAEADGTYAPVVGLNSIVVVDGEEILCDDRCELRVGGIGLAGATSAPMPGPVALRFLPGDPAPTDSTTTPSVPGTSPPAVVPIPPSSETTAPEAVDPGTATTSTGSKPDPPASVPETTRPPTTPTTAPATTAGP